MSCVAQRWQNRWPEVFPEARGGRRDPTIPIGVWGQANGLRPDSPACRRSSVNPLNVMAGALNTRDGDWCPGSEPRDCSGASCADAQAMAWCVNFAWRERHTNQVAGMNNGPSEAG